MLTIKHILIATVLLGAAASMEAQRVPQDFSEVHSPELPSKVTLCGDVIDLDRLDNYERFDRELTSVVYTHGTTLLMLKRANRYFPEMAPSSRPTAYTPTSSIWPALRARSTRAPTRRPRPRASGSSSPRRPRNTVWR